MNDHEKNLALEIERFIFNKSRKFLMDGYRKENLRIAIPEYLHPIISRGLYLLYGRHFGNEIIEIRGIKVHSSWENNIRLYHNHGIEYNIPSYILDFDIEKEQNDLYDKLTLQLGNETVQFAMKDNKK